MSEPESNNLPAPGTTTDDTFIPLVEGTVVDRFKIESVMDLGDFRTTYIGVDLQSGQKVAIQEFFPFVLARRANNGESVVVIDPGFDDDFEFGLTEFLHEARRLSQVENAHIATVLHYTEKNGTAYLITEYDEGISLEGFLEQNPDLPPEAALKNIFFPILDGLRVLHNENLVHTNIHPGTVFLRDSGVPVLLSIGLARHRLAQRCGHGEVSLREGYCPIELYGSGGEVGPWTDLYQFGATLYRCMTGRAPVPAPNRYAQILNGEMDPVIPAIEAGRGNYSSVFLGNIDWMINVRVEERPDSVDAVLGARTINRLGIRKPSAAFTATHSTRVRRHARPKLHADTTESADSTESVLPQRRNMVPWIAVALFLVLPLSWWAIEKLADLDKSSGSKYPDAAAIPPPVGDSQATRIGSLVNPGDNQRVERYREIAREDLARAREAEIQQRIDTRVAAIRDEIAQENIARHAQEQKSRRKLLDDALKRGEDSLASGDLISPKGKSAADLFQTALTLDPANKQAIEGLQSVGRQLVTAAGKQISDQNFDKAAELLHSSASIAPGIDGLVEAQNALFDARFAVREKQLLDEIDKQDKARQEQESLSKAQQKESRQELITDLLEKADNAYDNDNLVEPLSRSALFYYRRVLMEDPFNERALDGLRDIGLNFVRAADLAVEQRQPLKAQAMLETALAIDGNLNVSNVRDDIRELKTRAAGDSARAAPVRESNAAANPDRQSQNFVESDLSAGISAYFYGEYEKALNLLATEANSGNPRAQFRLAVMYFEGEGVAVSTRTGQAWLQRAAPRIRQLATEGVAWAETDLGTMYEQGWLVAKNSERAVEWFSRAAGKGDAEAAFRLGKAYLTGGGVSADRQLARRWLIDAARKGHLAASQFIQQNGLAAG